jgi:hypothetical protein
MSGVISPIKYYLNRPILDYPSKINLRGKKEKKCEIGV